MTTDRRILLVGAGHVCDTMLDALAVTDWEIMGIIDNNPALHKVGDFPVLGSESHLRGLKESCSNAIITLDYHAGPRIRSFIFNSLKQMGYNLPAIISPLAHVSRDARVGEGCVVFPYASVLEGAAIGANCLIDLNAAILENAIIGDHCVIGENAEAGAGCVLGEGVRIGASARINPGLNLKKKCVIGNNAIIREDIPAYKIKRE